MFGDNEVQQDHHNDIEKREWFGLNLYLHSVVRYMLNIIEEDRGGCKSFQGFVAKRKKKGENMEVLLPLRRFWTSRRFDEKLTWPRRRMSLK